MWTSQESEGERAEVRTTEVLDARYDEERNRGGKWVCGCWRRDKKYFIDITKGRSSLTRAVTTYPCRLHCPGLYSEWKIPTVFLMREYRLLRLLRRRKFGPLRLTFLARREPRYLASYPPKLESPFARKAATGRISEPPRIDYHRPPGPHSRLNYYFLLDTIRARERWRE